MLGMHLICLAFVCISDFIILRMKYNWPTCVWKLFWIKCMIASGPRFPFTIFIFQFLTRVNLLCPPVFLKMRDCITCSNRTRPLHVGRSNIIFNDTPKNQHFNFLVTATCKIYPLSRTDFVRTWISFVALIII
jgi:hypothetical protein